MTDIDPLRPRVGVLLPVRNGAATLRAALASLRAQTFRDFHVVAVDDGSADDTLRILREVMVEWGGGSGTASETPGASPALSTVRSDREAARGDPSLSVVRLDAGVGIAAALMAAAQAAGRPEFFARQDADDVSHPERFARQVEFLDAHPEVGLVATGVRTITPGELAGEPAGDLAGAVAGEFVGEGAGVSAGELAGGPGEVGPTAGWKRYERWLAECVTPEEIALGLWLESPLPHPTVMMRRTAYEQAGGYREVPWPEDYDLWLRMLRVGIVMTKVPEVLYDWADYPGRATRTLPAYTPEAFLACRAHHLARHLDGRGVIVWGAGRDGRRAARSLLRQGVDIRAFLDIDPRKIGRTAYGRPILAADEWLATRAELLGAGEYEGSTDAGPAIETALRAASPPAARPGPRSTGHSAVGPTERPVVEAGISPPLVLAAVGTAGARDLIRARLVAAGLREGGDFLCIA